VESARTEKGDCCVRHVQGICIIKIKYNKTKLKLSLRFEPQVLQRHCENDVHLLLDLASVDGQKGGYFSVNIMADSKFYLCGASVYEKYRYD
jgi:hypothetical protein